MKNYSKIFKLTMWVLIIISILILVWGFAAGWPSLGNEANAPVNVLLGWAYVMIALAVLAVVVVGAVISYKNNPKSLVKAGIGLLIAVAVCFVVYLVSPGKPALGIVEQPSAATLKLTDTVLNLTYIAGVLAIAAIVAGEIMAKVRNKQ